MGLLDKVIGHVFPTSKKETKSQVAAPRRDNQKNPKIKTTIAKSNHFNNEYQGGELTTLERDENYRSGIGGGASGLYSEIRGIEERPESYAVIRLLKRSRIKKNEEFTKFEKRLSIIPPFTRFFLQQTSYVSQEKYQIIETFGDPKILFFGKRPVIKQYSGYLLNTGLRSRYCGRSTSRSFVEAVFSCFPPVLLYLFLALVQYLLNPVDCLKSV